jgi:hypothetical protein
MTSKSELISQGQSAITEYQLQENRLGRELAKQENRRNVLIDSKNSATQQLVSFLMPAMLIDTEVIGQRIGYLSLNSEKIAIIEKFSVWESRIREIEATSDFQNSRLLIDNATGTLVNERNELNEALKTIQEGLANYNNSPDFQLLNKTRNGINPDNSQLLYIWQILTFQVYKYNKLVNIVLGRFDFESTTSLFADYDSKQENILSLEQNLKSLSERINKINKDVEDHANFSSELANRSKILSDSLSSLVCSYFSRVSDFTEIRQNLGAEYRIQLSTISGLIEQISLMDKSITGLKSEISDRRKRYEGIDKVVKKWRKSKKSSIPGDKSKWLVEGPKSKNTSTTRYIANSSRFSRSVYTFNDYGYHDRGMDLTDYMLLDLIMHQSNDRPSPGFLNTIDPYFVPRNLDLGYLIDTDKQSIFTDETAALNAIAEEYGDSSLSSATFGDSENTIADLS